MKYERRDERDVLRDRMVDHAFSEDWADLKRRFPTLYAEKIAAFEGIAGGKFKKVVDVDTGIEYAVTVERIATEGLKGEDLAQFPIWDEAKHGNRSG